VALAPRRGLAGSEDGFLRDVPDGERIGIALSGGGMRSAAFNLGALQALQERGMLARAEYLTAVSGGGNVAGAMAISAAYSNPSTAIGKPLWSRGSPEEKFLRHRSDYLAPGLIGRIWFALSAIHGFVFSYLPIFLWAFLAGRIAGWVLGQSGLTLDNFTVSGLTLPRSGLITTILINVAVLMLGAVALVTVRRQLADRIDYRSRYGASRSEPAAAMLVYTAGVLSFFLLLPLMAKVYHDTCLWLTEYVFGRPREAYNNELSTQVLVNASLLLLSLVLVGCALILNRYHVVDLQRVLQAFGDAATYFSVSGIVTVFATRARHLLLIVSSLASVGLLLVPLLSALVYSMLFGISYHGLLGLILAVFLVITVAFVMNNHRYSMHRFYSERMATAFALRRISVDGTEVADPISRQYPLYLSEIGARLDRQEVRLPRLVLCCAVSAPTYEPSVGRDNIASFTFEYDVSGSPQLGYQSTRTIEENARLRGSELTLPSITAAASWGLSPLMGRFTYSLVRFMMALANVRFGIWIANPLADRGSGAPDPQTWLRRMWNALVNAWRAPGALYVLRDALGGGSAGRYVYLTDGGQWDNLGLVELLRRQCTHILCFDATRDQAGEGLDLGRAVALARRDLNVEIEIDPQETLPDQGGESKTVAVEGVVRYPGSSMHSRLIYAKATLTPGTSWDLRAFRARNRRFPNHPNNQHIFTEELFEAYRSLGYDAGRRAMSLLDGGVPTAR
jgi:hypothetical protein